MARWSKPVFSTTGPVDLLCLVAHGGASTASLRLPTTLEEHALRAVKASHRDSALARMLPVFLWRLRHRLDVRKLVRGAIERREAPALGFFLETAAKLGPTRAFTAALVQLRKRTRGVPPSYFFRGTEKRPFERIVAGRATPAVARRWGLLMNMPWESFATYFAKTAEL